MTLYTTPVADPPPGEDWLYTVPGEYVIDVSALAATLATSNGPGPIIAHDASGNGNDGTYVGSILHNQPGIVAGDTCVDFNMLGPVGSTFVDLPVSAWDPLGDVTYTWWQMSDTDWIIVYSDVDYSVVNRTGSPHICIVNNDGFTSGVVPVPVTWPVPAPMMVAFRFTATAWYFHVNGTQVATGPVVAPYNNPPASPGPKIGSILNTGGNVIAFGLIDEVAVWSRDIGAGAVATLYNAGLAGFGAYNAAVLGLGPSCYYHLDDAAPAASGRTPSLVVTDGTNDVLVIPPGFPAAPPGGPFRYSWQAQAAAGSQDPAGLITTVPIPELIIPAGYTIGTRTPDLGAFDQWSQLAVWWSDRFSPTNTDQWTPYDYHDLLWLP